MAKWFGQQRIGLTLRRFLATLVASAIMACGLAAITPSPAHAISGGCSWPRCTLYLNKEETNSYAYGGVIPPAPASFIAAIWYVTALVHRWIAIQYANQGRCVGFRLTALPWESQGMFGYRC